MGHYTVVVQQVKRTRTKQSKYHSGVFWDNYMLTQSVRNRCLHSFAVVDLFDKFEAVALMTSLVTEPFEHPESQGDRIGVNMKALRFYIITAPP